MDSRGKTPSSSRPRSQNTRNPTPSPPPPPPQQQYGVPSQLPANWLNLSQFPSFTSQETYEQFAEGFLQTEQPPQYYVPDPPQVQPPYYQPAPPPPQYYPAPRLPQYFQTSGMEIQPFAPPPYHVEIPQTIHDSSSSRQRSRGRDFFEDSQPEEEDEVAQQVAEEEEDDETEPPEDAEEDEARRSPMGPVNIPQPRRGRRAENPPPRKKVQRSWVWQHFDLVEEPRSGICKKCKAVVSANSRTTGTNLLKNHFKQCSKTQGQTSQQVSFPDPIAHREALVRLIIGTDISISFIEQDAFLDYVRFLIPGLPMVSRYTIRRDILKYFTKKTEEIKAILGEGSFSVALTSDIWSGKAKEDYISVVVHNIDKEWMLNKRIIAFKRIEGPHTGGVIAALLVSVIEAWGLDGRIISITLDNATSNTTMMNLLRPLLKPILDGIDDALLHQRCATHIINLIVKSGMKRFKDSISNIRKCINWVNSSSTRVDELKVRQRQYGLAERVFQVDMDIRWNSTYLMLSNVLTKDYKEIFVAYVRQNNGPSVLTDDDLEMAECFVTFLEVFYTHTCQLSAVYTPTAHLALHSLIKIGAHLEKYRNIHPIFQECVVQMNEIFLKYWGPGKIPYLYGFGSILDPRCKLQGYFQFLEVLGDLFLTDYITSDYDRVQEKFSQVYRAYEAKYGAATDQPSARQHQSPQKTAFGFIRRHTRGRGASSSASPGSSQQQGEMSKEFNMYNSTKWRDFSDDNLDVLAWWKEHQGTFPILSRIARDVMTIPVSTVSSESAFSSAGRIIDDRRMSLAPDMVEAITIGKDWYQAEKRKQESLYNADLSDYFDNFSLNVDEEEQQ